MSNTAEGYTDRPDPELISRGTLDVAKDIASRRHQQGLPPDLVVTHWEAGEPQEGETKQHARVPAWWVDGDALTWAIVLTQQGELIDVKVKELTLLDAAATTEPPRKLQAFSWAMLDLDHRQELPGALTNAGLQQALEAMTPEEVPLGEITHFLAAAEVVARQHYRDRLLGLVERFSAALTEQEDEPDITVYYHTAETETQAAASATVEGWFLGGEVKRRAVYVERQSLSRETGAVLTTAGTLVVYTRLTRDIDQPGRRIWVQPTEFFGVVGSNPQEQSLPLQDTTLREWLTAFGQMRQLPSAEE